MVQPYNMIDTVESLQITKCSYLLVSLDFNCLHNEISCECSIYYITIILCSLYYYLTLIRRISDLIIFAVSYLTVIVIFIRSIKQISNF